MGNVWVCTPRHSSLSTCLGRTSTCAASRSEKSLTNSSSFLFLSPPTLSVARRRAEEMSGEDGGQKGTFSLFSPNYRTFPAANEGADFQSAQNKKRGGSGARGGKSRASSIWNPQGGKVQLMRGNGPPPLITPPPFFPLSARGRLTMFVPRREFPLFSLA